MRLVLIIGMFFDMTVIAIAQQLYVGLQTRGMKALSAQEIDDLRNGRGMGMTLAAGLNGYPGPVHVLKIADSLDLNKMQRARVAALFDAMQTETVPLGERLTVQEAELDRQFAEKAVTPTGLEAITASIATAQGALRAAHLKYHLLTLEVLSSELVWQYAVLRGYADDRGRGQQHRH